MLRSILVCLFLPGILLAQSNSLRLAALNDPTPRATELVMAASDEFELSVSWEPEPRWLSGPNWGGFGFEGSLGLGKDFLGSTISDDMLIPIEIRFMESDTTYAQTFRRDMGYSAGGVGIFRGSAWDISNPDQPRRLNVCFVEDSRFSTVDQVWNPDAERLGGREYLLIMSSDYDSTGTTYNDSNPGINADVLYGWWPRVPDGQTLYATQSATVKIEFARILSFRALPTAESIGLHWRFSLDGIDNFVVYGIKNGGAERLVATVEGSARSYLHTGLTEGDTWNYRIEGVGGGESRFQSLSLQETVQSVANGMQITGFLHERRNYGDIWGYTAADGKEYALMCVRGQGLSVIDINGDVPVELTLVESVVPNVDSKDVKVYKDYAILINENAPVQIIDISTPAAAKTVATIDVADINVQGGHHNAYVDGDFLYLVGNHGTGGMLIYDISVPTAPVYKSMLEPYYYHDLYVRNDTAYAAGIYGDGVDIIDVSDKENPFVITSFNYPGSGAHNAWTSEDGRYLFVGDEIGSEPHLRIFDIGDLNNIEKVYDYIVDPSAVVHNCYVKGDRLYVGHYTEGVRVLDISDPPNAFEIAYYDTYTRPGYGYEGCWSVYPYFESGKIIASDLQTGLYVLRLESGTTDIAPAPVQNVPSDYVLEQNYPNPFNPTTTIGFSLPQAAHIELVIYNSIGAAVRTLAFGQHGAGRHSVIWDGRDQAGNTLQSGLYFYRLRTPSGVLTRKLALIK